MTPQRERLGAELVAKYPEVRSALVPFLQHCQAEDGYVTDQAIADAAELVGITPAEVESTASFYSLLFRHPIGKHVIHVCRTLGCMLGGADRKTLFMMAAEWHGMENMIDEARTGQVLIAEAPAPGVGWLVGFPIATEIGDIKRFSSPRELCGYTREGSAWPPTLPAASSGLELG